MSKEIYISSTPHETRLAIVENDELTEIYYERENEYTLAGSIYNGKVTRVLPGMQSSFVDIGLERDAFLYITDFMEEAADTAEFDHSTGDVPRPARLDSQRGESGRNGRDRQYGRGGNNQSEGYVSERSLEQAAATPAGDLARASEGRGEEFGGRSDRGGRGRGRGRGSRSGGFERLVSPERDLDGSEIATFGQGSASEPYQEAGLEAEEPQTPGTASANSTGNLGLEVGEGAPGADGSRRWRGRRGRRRGRGAGPSDTSSTAASGVETAGSDAFAPSSEAEVAGGSGLETESSFGTDESRGGEPESLAHTVTPLVPRQSIQLGRGQDGSRDRGGRGERGDRSQHPPRVPRGFAPTRSLYGVESAAEKQEAPYGQIVESVAASGEQPEPLILPGESLSKYRKGGEDARPATPRSQAAATPETTFLVDPSWDGGAILPGETLSRYRRSSEETGAPKNRSGSGLLQDNRRLGGSSASGGLDAQRDPAAADRSSSLVGLQADVAGHDARLDQTDSASMTVASAAPAIDLQSAGPVSGYADANGTSEDIVAHQPDFHDAELPEATADAPSVDETHSAQQVWEQLRGATAQLDARQSAANAGMPAVEPEHEYEPEGQSASYRVDPVAPSEYRQTSSVAEEGAEKPTLDAAAGEIVAPEPAGGTQVGLNSELSESEKVPVLFQEEPALITEASHASFGEPEHLSHGEGSAVAEEAAGLHETTVVEPTGEMRSEGPTSEVLLEEEQFSRSFSPGTGDLEEDFIEEEELETVDLHARGDAAFDDLDEEEHLEGAADLGMMIRDMSLDQLTHTEGALTEGEDDFEEDTLEYDSEEPEMAQFGSTKETSFEEDRSSRGEESLIASPASRDGNGAASSGERRGRRENGRRGGRDRNGGREGGARSSRSDRSAAPETDGMPEQPAPSDRYGYADRLSVGERARSSGGSSDRDRGRSSGRGGRQSAQMTNLPAISDLLKPGQEILCQIAKEPIAKKGARITSHIALPGRFLVFMPTVSHTGVSRKIESDGERRRLKEILLSEKGEAAGGFIVRTAAAGASEEELRSDLRFLLNLWADIKQRSESSKSPALIYHDLNLVERILRDQVTDTFSAIWVDTETEYERVLRFLQRFQPGLIRRVKLYTKETPLFEQFGITEEINKALRSKVWLKSGGSIVINQTEALVAIDINTGKYVGKTARLEDTIVKTNLDAIPEIVRQIRLRDLGGIIIIDFIDMDERKNRNRVMAALEEELKTDRAPSKILPFNDFGLVAITRKRVKQSLERTLSTTCNVCTGTGMVKSPVTVCNDIYVEMRKMHKHLERGDVMLRVNPEVVKQLKSTGTHWLQEMEEMCGKTILIKSDPSLHPEQFDIH